MRGMHVVVGWIELFVRHRHRGSRWGRWGRCRRRRGLRREGGVDARIDVHLGLEVVGLFLELLAELPRHRARTADPAPDLLGELRQLLRPEHDQRDREDQQQFGKTNLEHGKLRRLAVSVDVPSEGTHRGGQALCSLFSDGALAGSENSASALSCLTDSSVSPSFIDFLKPRTAEPRSDPIVLSFLAPNTSSTTIRMTTSSLKPIGPMSRS